MCEKDAETFISTFAGDELNVWISSNVDVWKRLKKYRDGLKKLRFGEKSEWDF